MKRSPVVVAALLLLGALAVPAPSPAAPEGTPTALLASPPGADVLADTDGPSWITAPLTGSRPTRGYPGRRRLLKVTDVDGDARDDILTVEQDDFYDADWPLRARRGIDASVMWSRSLPGSARWEFGDVTGDGVDEILELRAQDPAASSSVSVLNLRDGTALWTRRFGPSLSNNPHTRPTPLGAAVIATTMPDADGDGRRDVFVTLGIGEAPAGRFISMAFTGITGVAVGVITSSYGAAPIADISGDGLADVLTLDPSAGGATLTAQPFAGPAIWAREVPPGLYWTAPLEGPHHRDILAQQGSWIRAYTGTNGAEIWSVEGGLRLGWNDLDGDGGFEILIEDTQDVRMLTGARGITLWKARGLGDPAYDMSGDGVRDVVLTNEQGISGADGRTGAIFWSVGHDDDLPMPMVDADVNGNGSSDLVRKVAAPAGFIRLEIVDGRDLSPIRSIERRTSSEAAADPGWYLGNLAEPRLYGANVDGEPGDEVIWRQLFAWTFVDDRGVWMSLEGDGLDAYGSAGRLWLLGV